MLKQLTLSMAVLAFGLTAPVHAQSRSAVTSADLDAAVVAHPTGNREALQAFLTTDQAQAAAALLGVNTADLSARVSTLDQASVDQLAQRAGVDDLAGGDQKVVISTTAIIIALLILILLTT